MENNLNNPLIFFYQKVYKIKEIKPIKYIDLMSFIYKMTSKMSFFSQKYFYYLKILRKGIQIFNRKINLIKLSIKSLETQGM